MLHTGPNQYSLAEAKTDCELAAAFHIAPDVSADAATPHTLYVFTLLQSIH